MTNVEQWKRKNVECTVKGTKKFGKKVVKETVDIEVKALFEKLHDMVPSFMQHVCNIMHQYKSIKDQKKSMKSNELLIHVDFSENYQCKYTKEIQSCHFGGSRQQVTLHTGVMYYKDENDVNDTTQCLSFCSMSQSLRHDASAIIAHLKPILIYAKAVVQEIKIIHFLSDSPTTQYRNRTIFHLISNYLGKFMGTKAITWNYSECGHGKGAPDGIGGYLKRTANQLVAEGTDLPTFQSQTSL